MARLDTGCVGCKNCIGHNFCTSSAGHDIELPRSLYIEIIANPEFWGFGTKETNVIASGWTSYSQGYYDFYDTYNPDFSDNACGSKSIRWSRPDSNIASEITGTGLVKHWASGNRDDILRGGAESYLNNYSNVKADNAYCGATTDPSTVFAFNPLAYAYKPKILFNNTIYKNLTGAWRTSDCYECYTGSGESQITSDMHVLDCSGNPKQHIKFDPFFNTLYDPFRFRCMASGYDTEADCQPDGTSPTEYSGVIESISRSTGVSPFVSVDFTYKEGISSALGDGQVVILRNTSGALYDGIFSLYNVVHGGSSTTANLVGSNGDTDFSHSSGASWIASQSLDPSTCCGGVAYNVDDTNKCLSNIPPYHADIGRVFNHSKNKIKSNEDKNTAGAARKDARYPNSNASGVVLNSGFPEFGRDLPYFGPYYEVEVCDSGLRHTYDSTGPVNQNATCYTKKQEISAFPDCVLQYRSLGGSPPTYEKVHVPRLAIVYKPCNYSSPCEFNSDGTPKTVGANGMPSGLQDLKEGFGGQEIVMYVNVGDAWNVIKPSATPGCTAGPDIIPSPITYPCFPKFDLNPTGYGSLDVDFITQRTLDLGIFVSGNPPYPAATGTAISNNKTSPYTTYGYIRNLCGHQTDDRLSVLKSLTTFDTNSATFNDISKSGNNVPYYVADIFESGGYWGELSDAGGGLVLPYFYGYESSGCGQTLHDLAGHYTRDGFPTEKVPFLVKIDHRDQCFGCAITTMSGASVDIQGLDTTYFINPAIEADGSLTDETDGYGYTFCRFSDEALQYPAWSGQANCPSQGQWTWDTGLFSDFFTDNTIANHLTRAEDAARPYTGNTCGCAGGVGLTAFNVSGTSIPKFLTTWNGNNVYQPFGSCGNGRWKRGSRTRLSNNGGFGQFQAYIYLYTTCGGYSPKEHMAVSYYQTSDGLDYVYGCAGCAHGKPATNYKPELFGDFVHVNVDNEGVFTTLSQGFLNRNLNDSTFLYVGLDDAGKGLGGLSTDDDWVYCTGDGLVVKDFTTLTYDPDFDNFKINLYACTGLVEPAIESDFDYTGCVPLIGTCEDCGQLTRRIPCDCDDTELCATLTYQEAGIHAGKWTGPLLPGCECWHPVYHYALSGENLDVYGNVSWSGSTDQVYISDWIASQEGGIFPDDFCKFDSTEFSITDNFIIPKRRTHLGNTLDLNPTGCTTCEVCDSPIPLSGQSVNVKSWTCSPEIMRVVKVECSGNGSEYALHVEREYYEHDRNLYELTGDEAVPVADSVGLIADSGGAFVGIPRASYTDTVTPCYPKPCGSGTMPYLKNQSIYPSGGSGTELYWNYYNLLYNARSGEFWADQAYLDPNTSEYVILTVSGVDTIFNNESEITKCLHSCIQDITTCNGKWHCNKEFFPRREYASGVTITAFGGTSICMDNADIVKGRWYKEYEVNNGLDIPGAFVDQSLFLDADQYKRFINPCEQTTASSTRLIEIDDHIIYVDDIEPLLGAIHPGFRSRPDNKTCLYSTGCLDHLPTHTASSIKSSRFTLSDPEMTAADGCLLNPFYIMVDVKCCPETIGGRGGDPTLLTWYSEIADPYTCEGFGVLSDCSDCDNCIDSPNINAEITWLKTISAGLSIINSGSYDLCENLGVTGVPSGSYCFNGYTSINCVDWRAATLGAGALYDPTLIHSLDPDISSGDMLTALEEGNPDAWPCPSGNTIYEQNEVLGTGIPNDVDLLSGCCGYCVGEYFLYTVDVTGYPPHYGVSGDYYHYNGKYWFLPDNSDIFEFDGYFTPCTAWSETPQRTLPAGGCGFSGIWSRCGETPNYDNIIAAVTTKPACHLILGLEQGGDRRPAELLETIGSGSFWNCASIRDTGRFAYTDIYNPCIIYEDYKCEHGKYDYESCTLDKPKPTTDCQKSMIKLTLTE